MITSESLHNKGISYQLKHGIVAAGNPLYLYIKNSLDLSILNLILYNHY